MPPIADLAAINVNADGMGFKTNSASLITDVGVPIEHAVDTDQHNTHVSCPNITSYWLVARPG